MGISTGAAILGAGALSFGGSLLAGETQADAAGRSADVQRELGNRALDFQERSFDVGRAYAEEAYDTARADSAPYRASGTAALSTLNDLIIPGGGNVVAKHQRLNELRARLQQLQGGERRETRINAMSPPAAPAAAPAAASAPQERWISAHEQGGP